MAQNETWLKHDLMKAVRVQYLDGNLFSMDNAGNLIGVTLTRDGEDYAGGGSVSANVIRADGGTVTVTGALSGNAATVVLPQAAYVVPGAVSIVVKLTASGQVTTIAAIVANVYRSSTDTPIDPGTIIPSVQALISAIDTAVASIPADYSSLWASLAPAFSTSSAYTAGQYVTYNGGLYRFTTDHAAGAWNSSHVVAVNIGGELSDLKSAFGTEIGYLIKNQKAENGADKNLFNIDDASVGCDINTSGTISTNVNRNVSAYIPVNPGDTIYFYYIKTSVTPNTSPTLVCKCITAYDINGNVVPSAGKTPSSSDASYTVPSGIRYIRFSYVNTNTGVMCIANNSSLSVSSAIAYTTPGYVDNYSVRFTDSQNLSDSQKGTARANIGAIGKTNTEYFVDVDESMMSVNQGNMFDIAKASTTSNIDKYGNVTTNANRTLSDYIPVNPGDTIYFYRINNSNLFTTVNAKFVCAFNCYKEAIPDRAVTSDSSSYLVKYASESPAVSDEVRFIRFSYVNTNSNVMALANQPYHSSSDSFIPYNKPTYIPKYSGGENWSYFKWMVVGDSLTDHTNAYASMRYYDYISNETGIQVVKKGRSGDGYARDHWFYDALDTVQASDFDFCTFFGSGNDLNVEAIWGSGATWEEHFGTVSDNGETTILGWVNKTIDHFISLYPLKKIGIVTPTPWAIYSNPTTGTINGTHMDEYANALVEICKNRGIPCLDLYHESGLRPWLESFRTEYYNESDETHSDGVHPNTNGHKWIYPMFKQFLKQFLVN